MQNSQNAACGVLLHGKRQMQTRRAALGFVVRSIRVWKSDFLTFHSAAPSECNLKLEFLAWNLGETPVSLSLQPNLSCFCVIKALTLTVLCSFIS